jgi:hypothetical protein
VYKKKEKEIGGLQVTTSSHPQPTRYLLDLVKVYEQIEATFIIKIHKNKIKIKASFRNGNYRKTTKKL